MKRIILCIIAMINTTYATLPELHTVEKVDLQKYLGRWFEIASLPQVFQKGCTATSAFYSKKIGEDIRVENKCNLGSPMGEEKLAIGRAWILNNKSNSKLRVQFFLTKFRMNIFAGDYWILHLDKDYTHVVVGDPSRKYLWFLSRNNTMESTVYNELIQKANKMGFDTSKMVRTIH